MPTIINGTIHYYTVVYRINGNMDLMELNSTDISVVVTGLYPFTFYTFHVMAVTAACSVASERVSERTNEAGKT